MDIDMQGSEALLSSLPLTLPPTLSLDVLQTILTESGAVVTTEDLQAPTSNVIIQIYSALLTIPALRESVRQFELEKKETERRNVDMEMQVHDAERLKDEAENRAEQDRTAKEEAIRQKNNQASQLAELQGTLQGLQSDTASDTRQSAKVKGQLEKVEQEKRDLLEMVQRERVECARRAEEIDNLTMRCREARSEASRLTTELQEAKGGQSTAMFKVQSLEQELALKSNDASWAHAQLQKTTNDLAQARNDAHNEVAALSSQLQQAMQTLEGSQAKASSLQSAYDNLVTRLDDSMREKSDLRQRLAEQEGAFAAEMSTQQRLSNLMEQAKDSAEKRMAEVEEQWEAILEQHQEKEGLLRAEILEEKRAREIVENEKQDLQMALDRLAESVGIETNGTGNGNVAGEEELEVGARSWTPNRTFTSLSGTPSLMSPTAALASRVQKSGKSFTQVYAELAHTQEELRRERLESNRIGGVLEQVMADLQERGPALVAQREECEQMSRDLEEMSITLARACEERDICEREARSKALENEASQRENDILNQQVTDLGRQVRDLAKEIVLRDDPSSVERMEDDGSQVDVSAAASSNTLSDTQAVISHQLITFRSLTDLVTQNGRLLRVVRELGTKMESEEQRYMTKLREGESEAVSEAKELITRLQHEVRAERTRSESTRRERDMFRSMCASGNTRSPNVMQSSSASAESSTAHVALTNQYSQLQSQFESFRTETARDTDRLKEEAYQARSEASRNALAAAKERATRESMEERLVTAQQTHSIAKREVEDLQRRLTSLQENLTKQEIASHSLSQQLLKSNSNEERLRNEVSNLTAEKRLHQQTAERLIEEKHSSVMEKASLSELLRNVQSMQAELEKSSGESRRRLETESGRLEEQCRELRKKISLEEEAHRQTSMRKEVETMELKTRLDKAVEDLSRAREDLAVAKISVQHLTVKSDDLQKQLNSKEEKLAVYEQRTLSAAEGGASGIAEGSNSLSLEQQLQVEVADLKGELRAAQTDAEQARGHVEQFKAIATANEEALAQLQATYDSYKVSTDASIAQRTSELSSLTERMEIIANELTLSQQEAAAARQEMEAQAGAWREEKRTLEDAMTELGGVESRARLTLEQGREEVKRHQKLTQEAHAKYEVELLAHAEDVKALTRAKEDLSSVRDEILEARKDMDTAQGNLASSRDSWEAQKTLYEQEHDELKKVISELRGQNDALHQHLEALQSQTNEIRQAASTGATADIGDSSFSQSGNEELHEVIRYLRREKKIVDLQVEVREQECARLRQSVEHIQRSVDDARLQLSKEREQTAGASASAQQHAELMEKINQLSILRESNTTLRDEAERALRKVQGLESQVEALSKELHPLREELRVKTVELEASENQLRITQEDNKRWQGRTQSILQQYNRIDPEDLKKLQEKKEEAEKEVELQKGYLQEKIKEVEAAQTEVQNKQSQFDRLRAQSIERIRSMNQKSAELSAEVEELRRRQQSTNDDSHTALETLKTTHEAVEKEKNELQGRVKALEAEKADLLSKIEELQQKVTDPAGSQEQGEIDASAASQEAAKVAIADAQKVWDEEKLAMEEKRQAIERREQMHLQKAKEFNTQMKQAIKERDELKSQIESASVLEGGSADVVDTSAEEAMRNLRQRIVELETQLDQANTRIQNLEAGQATPDVSEMQQRYETELKEQEARLSTHFGERQRSAIEIAVSKAKAAATAEAKASAGDAGVEQQVQSRLKELEEQKQVDLAAAIEAKEKELRTAFEEQLKARYEAGKEEATLRNKLMLKSKDNKIEKLTNELNALKGTTPAVNPGDTSGIGSSTTAPTVVQIPPSQRPAPGRPAIMRPLPAPAAGSVPAGPARGSPVNKGPGLARGPVRPSGPNVQKRKLEAGEGTNPASSTAAAAAANGATAGGGLPKRPRPAGGPISIRGGAAGGQRGGRGGGQAG